MSDYQPPQTVSDAPINWGAVRRSEGEFSCRAGDGDIPTIDQVSDDTLRTLPRSEWQDEVGMGEYVKKVKSQLDGHCTSNASSSLIEVSREMYGLPFVELSPEYLYHCIVGARWGAGSTLGDNIRGLMESGVCRRELCPQEARPRNTQERIADAKNFMVLEAIDLDGDFDNVVSAIHQRYPVIIGINWPGGGGHCVLNTDWQKTSGGSRQVTGKVLGPNSWGNYNGTGGFFDLTERQANNRLGSFGAFAVRATTEAADDPVPPEPK